MAECAECEKLRAQLKAAYAVLEHNMAVSNRAGRSFQRERDTIIRNLRKRNSVIDIAKQVGLTRQRVYQILNEAPDNG